MPLQKPYRQHINKREDLITSYEDTRAGFIAMALERTRRSTPFVDEARALKAAASSVKTPKDLVTIPEIRLALLAAAGVSDKAAGYFRPEDQQSAIIELIEKFLEPAGMAFVDELVYRFLLTRGDSLGGSLRNVAGALAQQKVVRSVLATLKMMGRSYEWLGLSSKNKWVQQDVLNDAGIELFTKAIRWTRNGERRTLVFNIKVPFIGEKGNNVDIVLFNQFFDWKDIKTISATKSAYILMGELKGGIDPAGSDEHWKTAGSAFNRIASGLLSEELTFKTMFIGGAIENAMANELWNQLEAGSMTNAANLTKPEQLASIIAWLCSL